MNISNSRRTALLLGLLVSPAAWTVTAYEQDFEGLDQASPSALSADGWLVFGNVFDGSTGAFLYGYGAFPAPNGGPGFSGIDIGQGGPDQGEQQLVVYNDYNNGDHGNGHLIEASVFQQQSIDADDLGGTWSFRFDAKRGNIEGATTALAFIKTLDPAAGFATTNFITVDMTAIPADWSTHELSITIGAGLVGQILQFGYASTATNFEGSGIFYDNVVFSTDTPDTDGDGVADDSDNCTAVANPDQRDADGDGIGSLCDADLTQDCVVNFPDLGQIRTVFFSSDANADLNGDGIVNFGDLGIMRSSFFAAPGPSGVPNLCD